MATELLNYGLILSSYVIRGLKLGVQQSVLPLKKCSSYQIKLPKSGESHQNLKITYGPIKLNENISDDLLIRYLSDNLNIESDVDLGIGVCGLIR